MKSLQAEQAMVRGWIEHHTPAQLLLPYTTWTRPAVVAAIHERLHIDMPVRTVGEYLKRWGFTAQRPAKQATEAQNQEQRRRWTEKDFPEITRRAKAEGAAVFFADETAVK
jgi:transposase